MKLFYSPTSPYARKVLLLAKALGFGDQLEVVMANPLDNGEALIQANPLNKVPALVLDDGRCVFDSPVIMEVLLDMAGRPRAGDEYFEDLQIQALADGILDAALGLVMEGRREDAEKSAYWQERWHGVIKRALDVLERDWLDKLHSWNSAGIAAACTLDYLLFRLPEIDWRGGHPALAEWFDDVSQNPDFQATDPRG
ncbi:MAG: glutathione S-transferase N-terminal domain-containing protein [Alphaproteobacteria bacterium]|nr:glutathione S-transferase N-terminal domain-containing protein [Alphaproteobacteria bacterium]